MSHTDHPATRAAADQQVELTLSGMTCASCANRIERKLNKLDGCSPASTTRQRRRRSAIPAPSALPT